MAGSSTSTSTGSSYSNPTVIQTPESEWGMQLSQLLASLGQNQYNWAMNQFNNGMGITDQNISHYMDMAGQGAGLAQNLLSRYENVFEPMMDQYIRQAGSYNSEDRQRFMMGQAESTVGQAATAARNEAERKLQGFGINPNSGRYQDLMLTSRIQDAAARAGAGTQAALNTADRGRAMTANIAQMGQNVPGMFVNAAQSAYTGITGAEQAILGMLNTGANLANTAAPLFNAASGAIKLPPVGNQSRSQQQSRSNSAQFDPNSNKSDSGKGQNQPQQQQGRSQDPNANSRGTAGNMNSPGAHTAPAPKGQGADAKTMNIPENSPEAWKNADATSQQAIIDAQNNPDWMGNPPAGSGDVLRDYENDGTGQDVTGGPSGMDPWDPQTYAGAQGSPWWASEDGQPWNVSQNLTEPFNGNWNGGQQITGQTDQNQPAAPQSWGANGGQSFGAQPSTDPWANVPAEGQFGNQQQSPFDPYGQQQNFDQQWNQPDQGQWDQYQPNGQVDQSQWDNNYDPNQWDQNQWDQQPDQSQWDTQGQDQQYSDNTDWGQGGNYDNYGSVDQSQPAFDNNYDPTQWDQNGDGGGDYARGGPVRPRPRQGGVVPTTGGPVPRSASPSRGRQTDDIPARLNADEFVIPRDVKLHKGTEFFQNIIKKSREARTGMAGPPAQPKMKPALRLRQPTFVSRSM